MSGVITRSSKGLKIQMKEELYDDNHDDSNDSNDDNDSNDSNDNNDDNDNNEDDDNDDEDDDEDDEDEMNEDKVDDLNYDLYNLAAQNAHTLRSEDNTDKLEKMLVDNTQRAVQLLMKKLFELPTEIIEIGPVAILPNPFTAIPREKRIPDPKPETKWEKFAKDKGIKNKKRDRMVYDEVDQQYKPRYGYKSCLLYTSPSPRDRQKSRMPSSA